MACLLAASELACVELPFTAEFFLLAALLRLPPPRLPESEADVTVALLLLFLSALLGVALGHASDADDAGSGDDVTFGVELPLVVVVAVEDFADDVTEVVLGESMEEEGRGNDDGKPPKGDIHGYAPAYGPRAAENTHRCYTEEMNIFAM